MREVNNDSNILETTYYVTKKKKKKRERYAVRGEKWELEIHRKRGRDEVRTG